MSLKKALREAAIRAKRYAPKLSKEQVEGLLAYAENGYSFSEVGKLFGVSAATVSYHVKRAGRRQKPERPGTEKL